MCGIVGLFLKDAALEPQLGALLAGMLATMCERGPDSAGFAVYGTPHEGSAKLTVQSADPACDFAAVAGAIGHAIDAPVGLAVADTHAVLTLPADRLAAAVAHLRAALPAVRLMSQGEAIEIYKETGHPAEVARRFNLAGMAGSHGIGHTRMATESAVTTLGAHPFSTGRDQCLVHNGSLSNHNALRRRLSAAGMRLETENDSEVAAAYLTWRMEQGRSLDAALAESLADLDGFFTFVVGTKTGFAVLRDPIACKPAIMAETAAYVAFGSEYRALSGLPGIAGARVWEPEPATVYAWERQ